MQSQPVAFSDNTIKIVPAIRDMELGYGYSFSNQGGSALPIIDTTKTSLKKGSFKGTIMLGIEARSTNEENYESNTLNVKAAARFAFAKVNAGYSRTTSTKQRSTGASIGLNVACEYPADRYTDPALSNWVKDARSYIGASSPSRIASRIKKFKEKYGSHVIIGRIRGYSFGLNFEVKGQSSLARSGYLATISGNYGPWSGSVNATGNLTRLVEDAFGAVKIKSFGLETIPSDGPLETPAATKEALTQWLKDSYKFAKKIIDDKSEGEALYYLVVPVDALLNQSYPTMTDRAVELYEAATNLGRTAGYIDELKNASWLLVQQQKDLDAVLPKIETACAQYDELFRMECKKPNSVTKSQMNKIIIPVVHWPVITITVSGMDGTTQEDWKPNVNAPRGLYGRFKVSGCKLAGVAFEIDPVFDDKHCTGYTYQLGQPIGTTYEDKPMFSTHSQDDKNGKYEFTARPYNGYMPLKEGQWWSIRLTLNSSNGEVIWKGHFAQKGILKEGKP